MSSLGFIEKLLDGVKVEWIQLSRFSSVTIGEFVHKNNQNPDADYPVYNGGTSHTGFYNKYNNTGNKIIVSARGANAGYVNKISRPYWAGNSCYSIGINDQSNIDWMYVYYFLKKSENKFIGKQQKGGIPAVSKKQMSDFEIPIPCPDNPEKSLAIQAEIVRILGAFTAMTTELTTELNLRQKQYNFYRDKLLSFEEGEVEWKTLLDACDYVDYRGKTPRKTSKGVFLVTAKNIRKGYIDYEASQEFISEDDYSEVMRRGLPKEGDVLITTEAPCGFVAQVDRENIALAQRVIKYRSKDGKLSNSFLKYYMLGSQFQNKLMRAATGSTVKGIKGSKLHQLTIPIPSEDEQSRIVSILEKFETLSHSISEGLPREIELRQKQYEYYRELLLSFPKQEKKGVA